MFFSKTAGKDATFGLTSPKKNLEVPEERGSELTGTYYPLNNS